MRPLLIRTAAQRRLGPGVLFVAVFVLPLLGWLSYNFWDQPLDPGAQALLDVRVEPVPETENLFLALLAFPISGEEAAHERGAAALAAYQSALSKTGKPAKSYAAAMDRYVARFDDQGLRLCSTGNQEGAYACLRNSLAQREELQVLMQPLRLLLLRYRELEIYPRYADTRRAALDDPAPDATVLRIAQLHLSGLAWMVRDGALDAAAEGLARSAAIWRRVLASADVSLIDKMLAARALEAHLLFASELIRSQPPLEGPALASVESLLVPPTEAERSLAGSMGREFALQAQTWDELAGASDLSLRTQVPETTTWWYRFLIKKNDSLNRAYHDLQQTLAAERAGCPAIKSQFDALARSGEPPELPWYDYVYNPIGRVLHSMGPGLAGDLEYLGRQCNLLALQRMVGLQLELRGSEATAAQVTSLASRFSDPNSGRAFAYDEAAQTLSFEFIGQKKEFVTPMPIGAP